MIYNRRLFFGSQISDLRFGTLESKRVTNSQPVMSRVLALMQRSLNLPNESSYPMVSQNVDMLLGRLSGDQTWTGDSLTSELCSGSQPTSLRNLKGLLRLQSFPSHFIYV